MGGTIRGGEWILVRKVDPEAVRPGDIVIYQLKHLFVAHRVIRRRRDGDRLRVVTKGDGRLTCDPPVDGNEIIARVVGIRKKRGVLRLNGPVGWALSKVLLGYSLFNWLVYRASLVVWKGRSRPAPGTGRGKLASFIRDALLLPPKLLVVLWQRLVRHSTR
jgi:hypothetical protein